MAYAWIITRLALEPQDSTLGSLSRCPSIGAGHATPRRLSELSTSPPVYPGLTRKHQYLLDVNPHWSNSDPADVGNKIDARFIDTSVGLYVDITVLHVDDQAVSQGNKSVLMCKDGHLYLYEDTFPLQKVDFEGVAARIPFATTSVLEKEYGAKALREDKYGDFYFNVSLKEWLPGSRVVL